MENRCCLLNRPDSTIRILTTGSVESRILRETMRRGGPSTLVKGRVQSARHCGTRASHVALLVTNRLSCRPILAQRRDESGDYQVGANDCCQRRACLPSLVHSHLCSPERLHPTDDGVAPGLAPFRYSRMRSKSRVEVTVCIGVPGNALLALWVLCALGTYRE
jgi:hypothetical protein